MEKEEVKTCEVCNQPIEDGDYGQWLHVKEPSIWTPSHLAKYRGSTRIDRVGTTP